MRHMSRNDVYGASTRSPPAMLQLPKYRLIFTYYLVTVRYADDGTFCGYRLTGSQGSEGEAYVLRVPSNFEVTMHNGTALGGRTGTAPPRSATCKRPTGVRTTQDHDDIWPGSGGGRESNPPAVRARLTGFEDRGGHQAPGRLRA
jgi:hypothetical protein